MDQILKPGGPCPCCGQPILTNDPLTLEQLREMDGEPVWLSGAALNKYDVYRGECPSGWADFYWGPLSFGSYGKTWQAYRRKPEEGTQ